MVEPVYGVFDQYSGPIVSLKSFGKCSNQALLPDQRQTESNSVVEVPEFVDINDTGGYSTVSSAMTLKGNWKSCS